MVTQTSDVPGEINQRNECLTEEELPKSNSGKNEIVVRVETISAKAKDIEHFGKIRGNI